jgi:hypothetical protein
MSAPTEDTTFQVKLDFPDAKTRADFETAFHGWLKEYQQRVTIHRALAATMAGDAAEGDDTAGHLLEFQSEKRGKKTWVYINVI